MVWEIARLFFKWQYRPAKHRIADPVSRSPALEQQLAACLQAMSWPSFDWGVKHCNVLSGGLAAAISCFPDQNADTYIHSAMWLTAVRTRSQDSQQDSGPVEAPPQPVSEPALYGPHDAERLSLLPELHEAYLQDPTFGDPGAGKQRKHFVAENGVWYRGTVIAIPYSPAIKRRIQRAA